MRAQSSGNLLNRLSVGRKLALLPLVFTIGVGIILTLVLMQLENQKQDAMTVHLGSRVRVFQERFFNQILLNSMGDKIDLTESKRFMTETTIALRDGGSIQAYLGHEERIDIMPAPTQALKDQLTDNLKEINEFILLGEKFLSIPKNDPSATASLEALKSENSLLDSQLRDTVREFTKISEEKIGSFTNRQTTTCAIIILVSSAIALIITRQVSTPMNDLVRVAEGIARGNLRQEKLAVYSTDEIGKLSKVFNTMLDNLRDLASQNISVAKNLGAASTEVLASVQQQAAATKQQAASVQETTTTMEQIGQSGAQIADRARQVSSTASDASQAGSTGLEAVQNTNRNMVAIREQVEAVAEKIVALSERTQAIGEIIANVTDIAEQSNLLALNAAIEAAAAGEQGRSFSVVANEIKNLADQAKESTVRVRSILGDIQSGINSSVMLTEEAVKRVESGKILAEIAEKTILQMSNTSKDSTIAFQQIVGATSQQQIGFEQITLALRAITTGAEQTAASTNQLERAALSLNSLGQQLQSTVERYQI
ncbi:MAG TPA: methyl-accepting chemotaxis protein [Oligoflexus sp.]|uniref:methyl-accepting chemotaxis protein n=1 Tax=Oligoflexus sp. TaxID=1971216 RepID=UPI002D2744DC|nr:methyl-accepting chemotaxis protein [Oligoflexus sp.]HYX40038.1 methyl-accepting chemotaxis protein [Oligoflexus sp.]